MKQTVYLAGGFNSDWAKNIKDNLKEHFYIINPKEKEFSNEERILMNVNEYGKWDLHYIKKSDIVFVYVERTNKSCIGLSVEAGYAKGLNKTVILVLEPNHETIKDSYLSFITQVADIVFNDIHDAYNYLKSFNQE